MIKWNEVTWYSRLGAVVLFLGIVPALCFYIGMQYEATILEQKEIQTNSSLAQSSEQPASVASQVVAVEVHRLYKATAPNRVVSEVASSTSTTTSLISHASGQPFAKTEAIAAARQLGFTTGFDENLMDSRFDIVEGNASSTGGGKAWYISGTDYHASVSYCPKRGGSLSNVIKVSFEMNIESGNIYIETMCQPVIFD